MHGRLYSKDQESNPWDCLGLTWKAVNLIRKRLSDKYGILSGDGYFLGIPHRVAVVFRKEDVKKYYDDFLGSYSEEELKRALDSGEINALVVDLVMPGKVYEYGSVELYRNLYLTPASLS